MWMANDWNIFEPCSNRMVGLCKQNLSYKVNKQKANQKKTMNLAGERKTAALENREVTGSRWIRNRTDRKPKIRIRKAKETADAFFVLVRMLRPVWRSSLRDRGGESGGQGSILNRDVDWKCDRERTGRMQTQITSNVQSNHGAGAVAAGEHRETEACRSA